MWSISKPHLEEHYLKIKEDVFLFNCPAMMKWGSYDCKTSCPTCHKRRYLEYCRYVNHRVVWRPGKSGQKLTVNMSYKSGSRTQNNNKWKAEPLAFKVCDGSEESARWLLSRWHTTVFVQVFRGFFRRNRQFQHRMIQFTCIKILPFYFSVVHLTVCLNN